MGYTNKMKKAVAGQIAAMLDNDVICENGFESFTTWCDDGEVFANIEEDVESDFVDGCMALVRELEPMVDAIHASLTNDEF